MPFMSPRKTASHRKVNKDGFSKPIMNVKESAEYLGISVKLMKDLLASREIRRARIGKRRIVIRRVDIDAYIQSVTN